uniref:uncharacterized protein LOC120892330 isoform X1 n=1 Tax=Ictidomys tridecemlineatus TaxID=43179 RepID=UPI001A9CF04C|nr:uncharacterized protein LOC120892330 isoform X1 [Ictidomys tridecemlineatus]
MAASCARLAGPQTPPGSSRRSLPPSQLLRRRAGPLCKADGLLRKLSLGRECGRGWRGDAEGPAGASLWVKEPCGRRVNCWTRAPTRQQGAASRTPEGGAQHPKTRAGGSLCLGVPPSPAEGCFDRKGAPFCLRAVIPTASRDHLLVHFSPLNSLLALPPLHALALFQSLPPPLSLSLLSLPSFFPGFLPSLRFSPLGSYTDSVRFYVPLKGGVEVMCFRLLSLGASLGGPESSPEEGNYWRLTSFCSGDRRQQQFAIYRYTRKTKAIQAPHLSSSLTVVPFLCGCFPCFRSSSYGRSRWLLIGGALWL